MVADWSIGGGLEKVIGRFVEFSNLFVKVRTSRQIALGRVIASQGVLFVPW